MPPGVLRPTVSADAPPPFAALKQSRSSNTSKDLTLKFLGPTASSFGDSSLYLVMLMGYVVNWICMSLDFKVLRLIRAFFGITKLIGVSFGNTRLIRASFGITRLISVSFGVTRLIRASFGITRLMCKGTARGRPTRGKKDA
ncbi:hypothetical protein E6C27_scaffold32G00010 [Cucumis melo var. makuwa]|uniref:Mucin-19-like n=1 Tax=Cucumis melo var. makuwa TaxID=1194695 RepID=A0A5A7VCF1_CUCMM|nr:hypothetical protein E6C27_scaffold32G00010 [Cucumis melo var. makuwa]